MTEDSREDIVGANSVRTVKPSIVSRGLRTHPSRYAALSHAPIPRTAEEFLVNSRLRRGDVEMALSIREYLTRTGTMMLAQLGKEARQGGRRVPLPPSVALQMSLSEVIQRRRSVRRYSGTPLPIADLATIVRAAGGITGQTDGREDGSSATAHRSAPSGGALYPIDLHVAALRVEGLARATYWYDPWRDQLVETGDESAVDALLASIALPGQVITEDKASAVCLLMGRPWRSMRKYGDRGMRYVFLEAGAMAEHISLAAAALGLGDVHFGSFYDDEAHEALRVDGLYEALIHSVFIGSPD